MDDFRGPAASFRRRELAAGLAAVAIAAQLALAPVTLLIAAVLTLAGRICRWRPAWLLLPAVAGACWLAGVTIPVAVAALDAGSGRLAAAELAVALHPARLLHPASLLAPRGLLHSAGQVGAAATAGAGWWLPRELPLALLAGTAEAAVMLWLGWRRSRPAWRPGAIALVRRRAAVAALAASRTVTASGCAIGLNPSSGRLAGFSWAEAQHGVLLAGPEERQLGELGLGVACAAMRLRKTLIVIDSSDRPAGSEDLAGQVAVLARRLSVPVTPVSALDGDVVSSAGRAIRSRRVLIVAARRPGSARQAVGDLCGVLVGLRDLGLRADCLAWVSSCDRADPDSLAGLLELGPATGTSILLSTTSLRCAASLASRVGTTIACGHPESPGAFTLVSARYPDAPTSGLLVPSAVGQAR
jgi:hypothetical protein